MKFEKKYAKVMREKEEIAIDQLRFLFSAVDFIVSTGKLAEFQNWQVTEVDRELNSNKEGGVRC